MTDTGAGTDTAKIEAAVSKSELITPLGMIAGKPPHSERSNKLVVLLKNGQMRECSLNKHLDYFNLFFTDCTHPAQNCLCNESDIIAWKHT